MNHEPRTVNRELKTQTINLSEKTANREPKTVNRKLGWRTFLRDKIQSGPSQATSLQFSAMGQVLNKLHGEAGPAGLMAGTAAATVVAVEIFVE